MLVLLGIVLAIMLVAGGIGQGDNMRLIRKEVPEERVEAVTVRADRLLVVVLIAFVGLVFLVAMGGLGSLSAGY